MCLKNLLDLFLLFFQIGNVIILLDSFICGLTLLDQVEMIRHEYQQSHAHDGTHYDNEKEKCVHDE